MIYPRDMNGRSIDLVNGLWVTALGTTLGLAFAPRLLPMFPLKEMALQQWSRSSRDDEIQAESP